jgi:hypothetical protein
MIFCHFSCAPEKYQCIAEENQMRYYAEKKQAEEQSIFLRQLKHKTISIYEDLASSKKHPEG